MKHENGNALWIVLIAIALFAALSYAVAYVGRNNASSVTKEKDQLLANEVIDFGSALFSAVAQMRLRGVKAEEISFAHPDLSATYGTFDTVPDKEVFNPGGGGLGYRKPDNNIVVVPTDYVFTGSGEITNVGTTCGSATCADLLLTLTDVKRDICIKINEMLGNDNPSGLPPEDTLISTTPLFAGSYTFTAGATVGDEPSSAGLDTKSAGCLKDTTKNKYVFYQVLLAR